MTNLSELIDECHTAFVSEGEVILVFDAEKTIEFNGGEGTGKVLQLPIERDLTVQNDDGKFVKQSGTLVDSPDHFQNNPDYEKITDPHSGDLLARII